MSEKNKTKYIKNGIKRLRMRFVNIKTFNLFLYFLIISACVSFIALKNDISIKGFVVSDLENKLSELQDKNTMLELDSMTKQSILALSEKAVKLNMVNAGNVNFIDIKQSAMAKK